MPKNNGEFEAKFYDVNGTPYKGVPVEDLLVKGVQVTAIMECTGVWFAGSKYGLTWKAKQIAIHKLPERIGDFAFKGLGSAPPVEEEDEDEVDDDAAFKTAAKPSVLAAVLPTASKPQAAVAAVAAAQDEDEVDDDDADDMEPIPAPKKPIIKKKVIGGPKK